MAATQQDIANLQNQIVENLDNLAVNISNVEKNIETNLANSENNLETQITGIDEKVDTNFATMQNALSLLQTDPLGRINIVFKEYNQPVVDSFLVNPKFDIKYAYKNEDGSVTQKTVETYEDIVTILGLNSTDITPYTKAILKLPYRNLPATSKQGRAFYADGYNQFATCAVPVAQYAKSQGQDNLQLYIGGANNGLFTLQNYMTLLPGTVSCGNFNGHVCIVMNSLRYNAYEGPFTISQELTTIYEPLGYTGLTLGTVPSYPDVENYDPSTNDNIDIEDWLESQSLALSNNSFADQLQNLENNIKQNNSNFEQCSYYQWIQFTKYLQKILNLELLLDYNALYTSSVPVITVVLNWYEGAINALNGMINATDREHFAKALEKAHLEIPRVPEDYLGDVNFLPWGVGPDNITPISGAWVLLKQLSPEFAAILGSLGAQYDPVSVVGISGPKEQSGDEFIFNSFYLLFFHSINTMSKAPVQLSVSTDNVVPVLNDGLVVPGDSGLKFKLNVYPNGIISAEKLNELKAQDPKISSLVSQLVDHVVLYNNTTEETTFVNTIIGQSIINIIDQVSSRIKEVINGTSTYFTPTEIYELMYAVSINTNYLNINNSVSTLNRDDGISDWGIFEKDKITNIIKSIDLIFIGLIKTLGASLSLSNEENQFKLLYFYNASSSSGLQGKLLTIVEAAANLGVDLQDIISCAC